MVRIDAMFRHQPRQRGAVIVEIALLDLVCRGAIEPQRPRDIAGDATIDLLEQPRVMRIQRVVEIEDPVADGSQTREHGHRP